MIVALLTVHKREVRAMLLGRLKNFIVVVGSRWITVEVGSSGRFRRFVQRLAGLVVWMYWVEVVCTAIKYHL